MCGVFGIVSTGSVQCSPSQARRLIKSFYGLSESRGKEAAGIALLIEDRIAIVKASVRGRDLLQLAEARAIIDKCIDALTSKRPFALIGHTRMVTNGSGHIHGNNQPVIRAGLAAIHNGIVVNDESLWRAMPEETRNLEVDTEVILALTSRRLGQGDGLGAAVAGAMREIRGANSIAMISADHDELVLATSNGSMFLAHGPADGLTVFASERSILENIIRSRLASFTQLRPTDVMPLPPGELALILLNDPAPIKGSWRAATMDLPTRRRSPWTVADTPPLNVKQSRAASFNNSLRLAEIKAITGIDWAPIRALRRCARCVLPETFPFIHFDASGVCNFCNNHRPLPLKGEELLRRELDAIRRSDGRPEVLFPLSGGRDSCYGLHLLVRRFGIKPVAYTYDWGMVTDLARRNISRMCGELAIEHVLVSADIPRKRDFIRKNVSAWLRRPHLGTVPLFMAGDKQYFYYANMLKKEMGLARTLLSANPLERTDFKVGFCGIDETYHKKKNRYYDPGLLNKLRLLGFYAGQFLSNPAYLNASLIDSAFAYMSYYLIPKDHTSIYDYLPWREHEVEAVLRSEYDWEISPDTRSTWRIGDGTAAFYNYIYLRVAGFTENDTFRSNQIREGLLDRETALARIEDENQPRVESLAWYFDAIELDAAAAIQRVNAMPRLY